MRDFLKNYDWLKRLNVISIGLVSGSLLSFAATLLVYFEMLNSFRVQYFYLSLLLSIPYLLKRKWIFSGLLVCTALINLYQFAGLYVSPQKSSHAANNKILVFNVFTANRDHESLIEYIESENPDIIALVEVNTRWANKLNSALREKYPHSTVRPRMDNFGMLLMSKEKYNEEVIDLEGVPAIQAEYDNFNVLLIHPLPPVNGEYFKIRNKQLKQIPVLISNDKENIVCGDFNAVPWSPAFKELTKSTGLRRSTDGYGVSTSWPTNIPPLRIPIDHCLVSGNIKVAKYMRGPDLGSDHFPLIIDLFMPIK